MTKFYVEIVKPDRSVYRPGYEVTFDAAMALAEAFKAGNPKLVVGVRSCEA